MNVQRKFLHGVGTSGTRYSSNSNRLRIYTNSNEVDPETLKIFEHHIPWNVPTKYHTSCGWASGAADAAASALAAAVLSSHSPSENLHKLQSLPYRKHTLTHAHIKHKSGKY